MTGQGDKNFERIKKEKREQGQALDVSKQFRTANGLRVRNLRVQKTNKVVIGGKVITTAHLHYVISGEVFTQEKWLPCMWDAQGKHAQPQFNLVEQKVVSTTQSSMF